MNKTKVMICGERQKPMRLQDVLVVYVAEVLVVIQYSVLVVRSGYTRSVVAYWQYYCMSLEQWVSAKLCGTDKKWNYGIFAPRLHHLHLAERPYFLSMSVVVSWL